MKDQLITFLKFRINNWFKDAREYYGIDGEFLSATYSGEDGGTVDIKVVENGKEIVTSINYVDQFLDNHIFHIWAEQFSMQN